MFLRYNFYALLWAGLIFVLSLLPGKDMPTVTFWELLSFDKVAHMTVYAVFVILLIVGFTKQYTFPKLRGSAIRSAILIAICYGGLLELLQELLMADRFADEMDFLANTIGTALGWGIFHLVYFRI
jgi:VanZ family protein